MSVFKKLLRLLIVFLFFCWTTVIYSQQTTSTAGGNIKASAGSVSYTIGQTFFSSNSNEAGTVAEGVQHAFETLVITNVEEQFLEQKFSVFPNPTRDMLVIEGKDEIGEPFKLAVYDINGKLLLQKDMKSERETIDLSAFSKGTYILQIINSQQQYSGFHIIRQ
ncbi:MAG: T9SS C-terminal target domain-containing protein [Saprospirales bacterium]|nr:MAG: T9SS C-terminal target domain-containing protein [Saprospirales bacterium]